ncbi:MAG TPA: hypothetical protein VM238_21040 [Phycisphaerae bacterium]|nr:hypothetical protein [Phycisphaerae bacterium]
MRFRAIIAISLLAALAAAPAGCKGPGDERVGPITLKPLVPKGGSSATAMYQVRTVLLQHRLRPDAPVEDVWRLLGTTGMSHEKRSLWDANDLRLGDGAGLAAERLNELLAETPDRTAKVRDLVVPENLDFAIALGGERETVDLVWTDAAGRLAGRHFDGASVRFRAVCRRDPADPDAVCIALVPEVQYGPERMRWVRTEKGHAQQMGRASCVLTDLAAEVQLPPGRLLVIGPTSPKIGPGISFGAAAFFERRGPDTWQETIILTAQPAAPGKAPQGGKVPFLPSAKPRPGTGKAAK